MKEEKKVKKILEFERSGETFAVEIEMKNVSPAVEQDTISSILDMLYENAKKDISAFATLYLNPERKTG